MIIVFKASEIPANFMFPSLLSKAFLPYFLSENFIYLGSKGFSDEGDFALVEASSSLFQISIIARRSAEVCLLRSPSLPDFPFLEDLYLSF